MFEFKDTYRIGLQDILSEPYEILYTSPPSQSIKVEEWVDAEDYFMLVGNTYSPIEILALIESDEVLARDKDMEFYDMVVLVSATEDHYTLRIINEGEMTINRYMVGYDPVDETLSSISSLLLNNPQITRVMVDNSALGEILYDELCLMLNPFGIEVYLPESNIFGK